MTFYGIINFKSSNLLTWVTASTQTWSKYSSFFAPEVKKNYPISSTDNVDRYSTSLHNSFCLWVLFGVFVYIGMRVDGFRRNTVTFFGSHAVAGRSATAATFFWKSDKNIDTVATITDYPFHIYWINNNNNRQRNRRRLCVVQLSMKIGAWLPNRQQHSHFITQQIFSLVFTGKYSRPQKPLNYILYSFFYIDFMPLLAALETFLSHKTEIDRRKTF